MFYSQLILAKKGPLGTIWIAAHLERKLRKNQVTETNISVSVDSILFPEAPIALRLSGHLLLGVVRIYSRKVNYLFHDCSEALTKIKQAFHAGAVDLPPEHATAPFHAITLPENFDLDEFEPLAERESVLLAGGAVDQHVTTREQITLQAPMEESIYFGSQFGLDERLPQADLPRMGLDFEEEEGQKEAQERERSPRLTLEEEVVPSVEEYRIDFDRLDEMEAMDMEQLQPTTLAPPSVTDIDVEMEERPEEQAEELEQLAPVLEEPERLVPVEEQPEQMQLADVPIIAEEIEEQVSFPPEVEGRVEAIAQEAGGEIVEVPQELVPVLEAAAEQTPWIVSPAQLPLEVEEIPDVETLRSAVDAPAERAPDLFAFEREMARPGEDLPARDTDQPMVEREQPLEFTETVEELRETSVAAGPGLTSPRRPSLDLPADDDVLGSLLGERITPSLGVMPTPSEEAPTRRFRRAPKPPKRKRKPVLDVATVLNGDMMRQQLADTADIRRVRKKAPCTQSELWTVQRQLVGHLVFDEPSIPGLSNSLRELYNRVLVHGAANLPLVEPRREVTPEVGREDVPATPPAEVPIEEPRTAEQRPFEPQPEKVRPLVSEPAEEFVEEPGLELAVAELAEEAVAEMQPGTAEVDIQLQPGYIPEGQDLNEEPVELGAAELPPAGEAVEVPALGGVAEPTVELLEAVVPTEQGVELPLLETEPEVAPEPLVPSPAPVVEPILLPESEAQEPEIEARVKEAAEEFVPMEEDVEVTGVVAPAVGEEQPDVSEQVASEAEAVAEAVATGEAVVVEGVDGRTIIVLEDDGTIIDEGLSQFAVKEEIVGEEVHEEELGFLGEPRETVFLQDDDDDLHEEAEAYDDSVQDITVEGFAGWSARTRAVGGYLQGVFASLGAGTEAEERYKPRIGLDHTLRGKTRKEAARLFFETLVLKTKDYIDVDQPESYNEIYISARPKLIKGSF